MKKSTKMLIWLAVLAAATFFVLGSLNDFSPGTFKGDAPMIFDATCFVIIAAIVYFLNSKVVYLTGRYTSKQVALTRALIQVKGEDIETIRGLLLDHLKELGLDEDLPRMVSLFRNCIQDKLVENYSEAENFGIFYERVCRDFRIGHKDNSAFVVIFELVFNFVHVQQRCKELFLNALDEVLKSKDSQSAIKLLEQISTLPSQFNLFKDLTNDIMHLKQSITELSKQLQ